MNQDVFINRVLVQEQRLYRVARSILFQPADQQDAVQEAILKAWSRLGSLREERYFDTWLIRILMNECKTVLRKQKRMILKEQLPDEVAPADQTEGDSQLDFLMDGLPAKWRLPLILHYAEGFSIRDISAMLRIPSGTVKKRLFEARGQLKKRLLQEREDESL